MDNTSGERSKKEALQCPYLPEPSSAKQRENKMEPKDTNTSGFTTIVTCETTTTSKILFTSIFCFLLFLRLQTFLYHAKLLKF